MKCKFKILLLQNFFLSCHNRIRVKCKLLKGLSSHSQCSCHNRIRVKCKCDSKLESFDKLFSHNRIRVKCKSVCHQCASRTFYVIIESEWNVNSLKRGEFVARSYVIIESEWNVNFALKCPTVYTRSRHNRIRVKCKFGSYRWTRWCIRVIIESEWNVNDDQAYQYD